MNETPREWTIDADVAVTPNSYPLPDKGHRNQFASGFPKPGQVTWTDKTHASLSGLRLSAQRKHEAEAAARNLIAARARMSGAFSLEIQITRIETPC